MTETTARTYHTMESLRQMAQTDLRNVNRKADLHYHALVEIAIRVLDLRNEIDHPLPLRQVFLF